MGAVGDHLLYAALWASFGLVHSVLAGRRAKAALAPLLGGYYRATYNVVAATHLGLIFWVEWRFFPDRTVFDYPAWLTWLLYVAQAGGWFVVALGLFQYDLGRFAGLTQARAATHRRELARQGVAADTVADPDPVAGPDEPLRTGGPHRYVRHPLYAGLFVVLWTRVFDEFTLATAVWGSLYLLVGTHYEERKLLRDHGDAYRRYRAAVPAYIPWRGRVWQD